MSGIVNELGFILMLERKIEQFLRKIEQYSAFCEKRLLIENRLFAILEREQGIALKYILRRAEAKAPK